MYVAVMMFWTFDVWYVLPRLAPALREDYYWLVAIWLLGCALLEVVRGFQDDASLPRWLDNPNSYTELTDGAEADGFRE